ncbi:hypothetical protein C900_00441 [Fulvivirga imtechensis AK7]|uniref:Uncharacterized protein n=1 Tax=Fulvivirga imtechensis AK7 TaxID=1237149 RepID=L8JLM1_9BACT|nr:hypothetical protein [Fulvivirga imtechensis]ELR68409.1 hypothetical protein C900_00441 [Fulvivirga imtechensis AK7]
MIRILLLGFSAIIVSALMMNCSKRTSFFSEITSVEGKMILPDYALYCQRSLDNERLAVFASFFGDYENTIRFATMDAPFRSDNSLQVNKDDINRIKSYYSQALENETLHDEELLKAKQVLALLEYQYEKPDYFANLKSIDALQHIASKAESYQFLLINEAHYSSQNRMFTNSLLKPLWEKGYRYLALETLGYIDDQLDQRGYALNNTGYYTKDPSFALLVSNALNIGYKLVAYETQDGLDGTARDHEQALNLFNRTVKRDSAAKVLVHAGYGHILELGDSNYEPMAYQLKKLLESDVLTVDQESMLVINDTAKMNPLYHDALEKEAILKPTVFINEDSTSFVEPLYQGSIDIQVYHPKTEFRYNRPIWLRTPNSNFYKIPNRYLTYEGSLIQAIKATAHEDAVPTDQTIIHQNSALILEPGDYELRVINCDGTWVGSAFLKAY